MLFKLRMSLTRFLGMGVTFDSRHSINLSHFRCEKPMARALFDFTSLPSSSSFCFHGLIFFHLCNITPVTFGNNSSFSERPLLCFLKLCGVPLPLQRSGEQNPNDREYLSAVMLSITLIARLLYWSARRSLLGSHIVFTPISGCTCGPARRPRIKTGGVRRSLCACRRRH